MEKQKHAGNSIIYSNTSLVIIGIGLFAIITIAVLLNYSRCKEYPELLISDSLNDAVQSVKQDRGAAFVVLNSGKKHQIPWADNLQYSEEFVSLASAISPGVIIIKRAFSDTIRVKHFDNEYVYVANQTIK